MIYINKNPDFLFDYPDGSAYYSHRNKLPEQITVGTDLILVFEPKYHNENFYDIYYKLHDLPQEVPIISHLWFHVKSNSDYQITDDIVGYFYEENCDKPLIVR